MDGEYTLISSYLFFAKFLNYFGRILLKIIENFVHSTSAELFAIVCNLVPKKIILFMKKKYWWPLSLYIPRGKLSKAGK